ncbi:Ubiquitin carboxyl-terminal hydrolase [Wickerhamomyces ciferrii]|uniref:Ubiquitin carboxyl-terminal hydrolase n=1 Tax=Wickerhamomyces ciferrii (strain ATCC 14091 / BCRC 22168 / CBS 111 / JCM 3599 / NBRC 0793 / NRRL Y-1031 F-60-10) TaxID=1206466 RepID=K0KU86_WICCF|nr:Ubiquitin carboxyl-terminal hydrolase [Wickerhamomyces ciferrii]CCH45582.1 Ubiquitin carboxyl-terminal hydrolase [Wickerhamomyces ciferrii]
MSGKTPSPFSPDTSQTSISSNNSVSNSFPNYNLHNVTLNPCSHLSQVLNSNARDTVIRNFSLASKVASFNTLSSLNLPNFINTKGNKTKIDHHKILKLKSRAVKCRDCSSALGNTFMCLQCPHVGCWNKHHFIRHAKLAGHIFGGYKLYFIHDDYSSDV